MAGVKISALPAVPAAPQLTDIMPEVQPPVGGVTYKVTLNQLLTLFQANIQITETQVTNLVTDLAAKVNRSGDTMTGFLILNADPVQPLGAATKQYVDNIAQGLNILAAAYAGTTGALNATYSNGVAGVGATLTNAGAMAAFSVDSVSPPINSRILVKNQASAFQNGVYNLTVVGSGAINWVLTRSTDYDQASEINPGDFIIVDFGTVNTSTAWIQTATVVTVGTDAINWSQFGAAFPLAMSSGGSGAALTPSNGGIVWTNASTMQILAGTATARQMLQSGATATPAWSTSTWPATTTINQILFSSAANVVGEISTTNSGVLTTSATGVPSIVTIASLSPTQQILTTGTAATYTTPVGCTWIRVSVWAGGAGGGGAPAAGAGAAGASGGGGGGGFCQKIITSPAATYTYTVGAAANGGAAGANIGTAGNASSFSTLTANGGVAGQAGAALTGQGITALPSAGGTASGGDVNIQGGYSTYGSINAASVYSISAGGSSPRGGQMVAVGAQTTGINGEFPGGGGSGATSSNSGALAGGNGAAGLIIVEEYYMG